MTESSFDLSAAALAVANEDLSKTTALRQIADTRLVDAHAANAAAADAAYFPTPGMPGISMRIRSV